MRLRYIIVTLSECIHTSFVPARARLRLLSVAAADAAMSNYCGATARAVDISLSETAAAAGDAADRYCSQAAMFCLFRIKCSRTSMADKNKKKSKTAQSHMHTQTPKITNTPIHHHADTTMEKT